jgi:hypothetical protein
MEKGHGKKGSIGAAVVIDELAEKRTIDTASLAEGTNIEEIISLNITVYYSTCLVIFTRVYTKFSILNFR